MDGIAWAAAALDVARGRLDVATGNLANVSTDGFSRRSLRAFLTPQGLQSRAETSHEPGVLRRTGRDDDYALVGSGAFELRAAHGSVVRTRDGAFVRDRDGYLRDRSGSVLLDAQHRPVRLREGERLDGTRLGLPPGTRLQSGFLEGSNVDAVSAMVEVLQAERSFESAQKVVAAIDRTREKAATDVAAVK